jgi:spore germination cell wall hydrolase CwlJ-like protein
MEITQDQFTANLQQMPQEAQVQVVQIIENNEPPALQAFAASLGVTLSTGEEQPMMPGERNLQEMQEFENRTDPDPDPDPDLSDPMANVGQVTAPEAQPATAPLQDQMQQLAMGDQVAGMIDQPGAEDQTGVADDVPMNVREGAFIINAAALAKVGRKDFEERIIEPAIEYLKEKDGIEIDKAAITKPAQQVNGDQKILASNKEYHIPPELAEVIGTDLLEKINNSGKEETEKKLEEQEQQPQQKQEVPVRAAKGLQVDKKKVDQKEVDMLARLLISEAGGEGREGMQVVANVVGNRLFDRKTNFRTQKTYKDVISAPLPSGRGKEFTGYDNENYKNAENHPRWKDALDLAQKQVSGNLDDITEGSTFYRNKNIKPGKEGSTARGQEFFDSRVSSGRFQIFKTIGGHTLYKDKDSSTYIENPIPRPKRKPAPAAQETQNSFMGNAPPIGSLADEVENLKAREQLEAATRNRAALRD